MPGGGVVTDLSSALKLSTPINLTIPMQLTPDLDLAAKASGSASYALGSGPAYSISSVTHSLTWRF